MSEDTFKQPRAMPIGQPQQRPNVLAGELVDDFLHEQLGFVRLYAEIGQKYIDAGDMGGLRHAMRHVVARVKVSAGVLNDIASQADAEGGSA